MTSLNDYLADAQRLLREQRQDLLNPDDLRVFINRARREIAMRTQCVRVITPISGPCVTASVASPGSGYVAGSVSVVISAPDFPSGVAPHPAGDQAIAAPIIQSGSLAAVNITYGGDGYFQPTASVVSAVGVAANVSVQTQPINVLTQSQEVYKFSDVDLSRNPGAESIYMVRSISIIYSNYRYSIPIYPFTQYQAYVRSYPFQYEYVPTFASQFGQGAGGSFYVYPLPSQTFQYELDAFVLPQDLITNLSVEIIPAPWTDAIVFYTCFLGMMSLQNFNAANFYKGLYEDHAQRFSNYARPGRGFNPYGRW